MAGYFKYNISQTDNGPILHLEGNLDTSTVPVAWRRLVKKFPEHACPVIDLKKIKTMDMAGASFICHLETRLRTAGIWPVTISGLKPDHSSLIDLARKIRQHNIRSTKSGKKLSCVEKQGRRLWQVSAEARQFISYTGKIFWALVRSLVNPSSIRWQDVFHTAEQAGVNALPIIVLISFIVGLVMAFQAAIPMKMFGTELYVADLIGIAMVRELGPLMTAIVLAGRSASAFAAEIGTMRINEEIDALNVMGLDPVRFLIVPRMIASTFTTPLLAVFANLAGILGGALVIISMGYPVVAYYSHVASFVETGDFAGGMVKCFVFGILIAGAGCIRGYQAGSGPSAVGIATTKAVVTGIILIVVFDGIFSVIYYYLGV